MCGHRVGIDPSIQSDQFDDIIDAAVREGVLRYDCCAHGVAAPLPARLLDALHSAGFDMGGSNVAPLVSVSTNLPT